MDKKKEFSWIIGMFMGLNKVDGPKSILPDTGKCLKHGYFTLDPNNSKPHSMFGVVFKCPYCMVEGEK